MIASLKKFLPFSRLVVDLKRPPIDKPYLVGNESESKCEDG